MAMHYAGVVAWSREADPSIGEYGPPLSFSKAVKYRTSIGDCITLALDFRPKTGDIFHLVISSGSNIAFVAAVRSLVRHEVQFRPRPVPP